MSCSSYLDGFMKVMSIFTEGCRGQLSIVYRSYGNQIYLIKSNGISSKQFLCQYYTMDTPHGRRQNAQRKSYMGTAQEFYELYWTNTGSNIPRNNNTATYHKYKLATVVEGDSKVPFYQLQHQNKVVGCYSSHWIALIYSWYVPCNAEC